MPSEEAVASTRNPAFLESDEYAVLPSTTRAGPDLVLTPTELNLYRNSAYAFVNVKKMPAGGYIRARLEAVLTFDNSDAIAVLHEFRITESGVTTLVIGSGVECRAKMVEVAGVPLPHSWRVSLYLATPGSYTVGVSVQRCA